MASIKKFIFQPSKSWGRVLWSMTMLVILLSSCAWNIPPETTSAATTSALLTTKTIPTATVIQVPPTPTVGVASGSIMPTPTPDIRPMPGPATPIPTPTAISLSHIVTPTASPAFPDVMTQLTEQAMFYLDGGQFPFEIWTLDLKTRKKTRIFYNNTPGFEIGSIALSPDKKFLVFDFYFYDPVSLQLINRSGLQIMRTDGSEPRVLVETTDPNWSVGFPRWSPDGNSIAYLREYLTPGGYPPLVHLHILDLKTGQDRVITEDGGVFDWSTTGDKVACVGRNSHGLYELDLQNGQRRTLWKAENLTFGQPVWQPGGEKIAIAVVVGEMRPSASPEAGLYIVDVKTGERHKLSNGDIYGIHWSPDGKKLAYLKFALRTNRLWLTDLESQSSTRLLDTSAQLGDPAWSANGRALLLAVEEEPERSYWISIMDIADHSLTKLVLAETMLPYSTW